jgi:D-alanyl-D-alanine carboxypeptidase
MIRKTLTVTTAFLAMLFILVACNFLQKETPQEDETVTNSKTDLNENDSTEVIAPGPEDNIVLPDEDLQKGDQGESVQLLQEGLIAIGYPIELTEAFDENTIWALTDIQLQHEDIYTTGLYDDETKKIIYEILSGNSKINVSTGLPKPKNDQQDEPTKIVENPYEILSLVNKQHALPADYIPNDLVTPNVRFPFTEDLPKKQLRKVAADALEELFAASDEAGLNLFAQSGYRSYDRQDAIFAANVDRVGEEAANNFSARPGESEHQTGLTMDVTSPDVNFDLIIEFGDTKEGKWIKEHASDYGFIIRYVEGKEAITEYQFEPWHLRYVGVRAAKEITSQGITLEEYLGVK